MKKIGHFMLQIPLNNLKLNRLSDESSGIYYIFNIIVVQ